jgi:hypothetical protein
MSPHDNEPLHNIPELVPDRDELASRQRRPGDKSRAETKTRAPEAGGSEPPAARHAEEPPRGSRGGPLVWVLALLAIGALGWAGWLQMQLMESQALMGAYQLRVEDLEGRLSVTDESVNESSVAMQVKLKELDGEIRKLWDNVAKKQQQAIEGHTGRIAALEKNLKAAQGSSSELDKKLTQQGTAVAEMRKQLERSAKAEATVELNKRKLEEQQVALESLVERINRVAAEQTKLMQRVGTNEEWVQSINNFRRQTNRELVNIKQQLGIGAGAPLEPLGP